MKFINWLVYSSENPSSFSLTLKGIVATIFPIVIMLVQQLGFTFDTGKVEAFILSIIAICTTAITLVGAVRKIYNTMSDKKVVTFVAEKKVAKKTSKKIK